MDIDNIIDNVIDRTSYFAVAITVLAIPIGLIVMFINWFINK